MFRFFNCHGCLLDNWGNKVFVQSAWSRSLNYCFYIKFSLGVHWNLAAPETACNCGCAVMGAWHCPGSQRSDTGANLTHVIVGPQTLVYTLVGAGCRLILAPCCLVRSICHWCWFMINHIVPVSTRVDPDWSAPEATLKLSRSYTHWDHVIGGHKLTHARETSGMESEGYAVQWKSQT